MLRDITGKLDRYMPAFKRIGMEAIMQDMDSRIDAIQVGVVPAGSISVTELSSGVQLSIGKADSALQDAAAFATAAQGALADSALQHLNLPVILNIPFIATPASATAEDCANKINDILTALQLHGYMSN